MTSKSRFTQPVSRPEWRWVIKWIIIAVILSSLPYVIGFARSTPDRVFGGFTLFIDDGNSYLAKMNEGARGDWSFHLPYTSEPHPGTFLYIFHVLLGKVDIITGLSSIVVYHLMRLISIVLLLLVTYRFIAMFAAALAVRRIAFLLITFGGGLGWLLILTGQGNWLGSLPLEVVAPEAFTFLMIYAFPHIALARMFLLLGFIFLWRPNPRALWAGVCWLIMGIIVPVDVAIVYAILFAATIVETLTQRRLDWPPVIRSGVAALIAAPVLIYTVLITRADPIWTVWSTQVIGWSLNPLHYVIAYLIVGTLAIIGLRHNLKSKIINHKLLGWLIILPMLTFLPFAFQRRLIETWQIPLCIFGSIGLVYRVLPKWRRSRLARRWARRLHSSVRSLRKRTVTVLLCVSSATYVVLLGTQSIQVWAQQAPFFRDGGEVRAFDWLNQRTTVDDVVLSSFETGNYLPAHVAVRAFFGHNQETAYSDLKRSLVAEFFNAATPSASREKFLRDWPITYVFYGPLEKQLGLIDLSGLNDLTLVYDQFGYQIYQVKP